MRLSSRFAAVFVVLGFTVGAKAADTERESPGLVAVLSCPQESVKVGESPKVSVELLNLSKQELTLVLPGDGSDCGMRTPIIQWNIDPEARVGVGRCGNINTLKKDEIVKLKPGERLRLSSWIGAPRVSRPGEYKISFRYENDPNLKWGGLPLGKHDPQAMAEVKRSTKVTVESNAITLRVEE